MRSPYYWASLHKDFYLAIACINFYTIILQKMANNHTEEERNDIMDDIREHEADERAKKAKSIIQSIITQFDYAL